MTAPIIRTSRHGETLFHAEISHDGGKRFNATGVYFEDPAAAEMHARKIIRRQSYSDSLLVNTTLAVCACLGVVMIITLTGEKYGWTARDLAPIVFPAVPAVSFLWGHLRGRRGAKATEASVTALAPASA